MNTTDRILILDGATGTMIQKYGLAEKDYAIPDEILEEALSSGGESGEAIRKKADDIKATPLKGNSECLNLSRPDVIREIHKKYIAAGADIIEANTFSANRISQEEYGCSALAARMAFEGAAIARKAADEAAAHLGRKIYVAGSMGPTSKSLSLSPDVSNPSCRTHTFRQMKESYREQAENLLRGGADILLLETCFDALNVKAALSAITELGESGDFKSDTPIPVIVSVSVGDRSGRTLTGQTLKAFYTSVRHYPLTAFGLNCSLGADELLPLLKEVSSWCECKVTCYPNAGLPNEMGGYDQTPEQMAVSVRKMAQEGLLNIVGGCCGTTPEHIAAIKEAVNGLSPRKGDITDDSFTHLTVSGLDSVTVDPAKYNFMNVGERTNVAGSRKFAKLIAAGEYDKAMEIASGQVADGASVIDINMDDAMLDSRREMELFVRSVSNDPSVARAALMIDSSDWDTVLAGLENAQGKCIVNSISLKEGEDVFLRKAMEIRKMGAAMVVMAFDENGQATTFDRKTQICQRAYRLLTEKAGICPHDIIFDCNILSIGTGIAEHARYGIDFIEAVRWIKRNLPGALTSGGLSNLSFAFRGNNPVREAMHSAFLYHAIKAGLDMAIVNPSMLQVYDSIDPALLKCVEDVIFDSDEGATERLISIAAEMLAHKSEVTATSAGTDNCNNALPVSQRLSDAIVKGVTTNLERDIQEAMEEYKKAVDIIQGPLMAGMEDVGNMFAQGKMFLPQVVKSAKVMRDAVTLLEPFMKEGEGDEGGNRPVIVIATVKGDVHDIGKNITGIVLSCNGFEVRDLGVMVDGDTILEQASKEDVDIVAASGLITPSLFQMEELCKEMNARGMSKPLFIGGATTSALHTAVKLAPLYDHVYYGPDASATAVMAKKYMIDPDGFEKEQHIKQQEIRELYYKQKAVEQSRKADGVQKQEYELSAFMTAKLEDIPVREISCTLVEPWFDWKMFYAIWGVKYGKAVPEVTELAQLRRDAEEELAFRNFHIRAAMKFYHSCHEGDDIVIFDDNGKQLRRLPMLRQETGKGMSLADFAVPSESGLKSVVGAFAVSVHAAASHEEGCCCPACSDAYSEMVGKTVRMTLAEAASRWIDEQITGGNLCVGGRFPEGMKVVKPAAGYASCPDHSLKKDLLEMIPNNELLDIKLTESYGMIPDASVCGMVFIHKNAQYPEIRSIGTEQYEDYIKRRSISREQAERLLGHLLK